jgi:hypothetical protein
MSKMYGPKRVQLSKEGIISLCGDKTYHPIGKYSHYNGQISVIILNRDNIWERQLNANNSQIIRFSTKSEVREYVKTNYFD